MRRWLDRLDLTLGRPRHMYKVDFPPVDPVQGVYAREGPSVGDDDQGLQPPAGDLLVALHGVVRIGDAATTGGAAGQRVGAELDRRGVELHPAPRAVGGAQKRLTARARA